jgi:hypothetical protein
MANEARNGARPGGLPPGKVRCFITQRVVDETLTVELVLNGVRVRVLREFLPQHSDPPPLP